MEAEDQRFRAEKSWRSKHWNKEKKQTPDLQRSRLVLSLCIPQIDKTTQLHGGCSGFRYPAMFAALHLNKGYSVKYIQGACSY